MRCPSPFGKTLPRSVTRVRSGSIRQMLREVSAGFRHTLPGAMERSFLTSPVAGGASQRLTVGGLVQLNTWQHFVFQRDVDGNMEIWVDGVQAASQGGAEPLDVFNGIITIGAEGPTTANSMAGRIDDFGIFNEVLDEIRLQHWPEDLVQWH